MPTIPGIGMRRGRLSRSEQEEVARKIAHEMVERGETRRYVLAQLVNISTRRIMPHIERARKLIAEETNETPEAARTKCVGRFDKLYRESISLLEASLAKKDYKSANAAITNANAIVANEAKIRGVESLPAQGNAALRFTLEATGIPPAVLERLTRLSAKPGSGTVLALEGEVSRAGDSGEVREDDEPSVRALAIGGDAPSSP